MRYPKASFGSFDGNDAICSRARVRCRRDLRLDTSWIGSTGGLVQYVVVLGFESVIEPPLPNRTDEYARTFAVARQVRRAVDQDFLESSLCERLGIGFRFLEERHALGEAGGKAVRMDVGGISGAYCELDRRIQSPEFPVPVSAITGILDSIFEKAARCWTPAAGASGGDQRSLAYKILTAALGH